MPDSPILKIIIPRPTATHRHLTIIINSMQQPTDLMELKATFIILLNSSKPILSIISKLLTSSNNQVSLIPLLLSLLNRMWKTLIQMTPRQQQVLSSRPLNQQLPSPPNQVPLQENLDGGKPLAKVKFKLLLKLIHLKQQTLSEKQLPKFKDLISKIIMKNNQKNLKIW